MKSHIITFAVAISLGLVIGWKLKPSGETLAYAADSRSQDSTFRSDRSSKLSIPLPSSAEKQQGKTKSSRPGSATLPSGDKVLSQEEVFQMAEEAEAQQQKARDEKLIWELVKTLKLNPGQEQQIREYLAKVRAGTGLTAADCGPKDIDLLAPDNHMNRFLESMLTEEQKALYAKDKEESRLRKIESVALTQLAKMNQIVKLREDQKDAAYQALYNQEIQYPGSFQETMSVKILQQGAFKDGVLVTGEDSGATTVFGSVSVDVAESFDHFQKNNQMKIDRQVQAMSAVLDEDQLKRYRDHLENK